MTEDNQLSILQLLAKNLSDYRSVLCLDGDLPYDFIKKINLPVIAADGAANTLVKNGIKPKIIVGDLDSIDQDILHDIAYLKNGNQDTTDFEKCLNFVEEKSMTPTVITGINGGRCIDHVLGNVCIFSRTKFVAISNDIISMIIDSHEIFTLPMNTKISIFGMPSCIIKSKGLKWELNNERLCIPEKISYSNRSVDKQIELNVSIGRAIAFIYYGYDQP